MNESHHKVWRNLFIAISMAWWLAAVLPVGGATLTNQPPTMPLAVATNAKVEVLMWDAPKGITKFAVCRGAIRNGWTNRAVISTNQIIIQPGVVYGVSAIDSKGAEGLIAYWPSNRIGEIRLREVGKTNFSVLERFTNNPPESQKLWRVENITTGWQ